MGPSRYIPLQPAEGYHVADVLVDGISVGAITSYTFSNVTSIHSIQSSFAINTYTIIATAGENGSIVPPGSLEVSHGSNQAYTITPEEGYHIADVLVDGISVGAVPTYTFSNVTAAHSIEAVFAINTYTIASTAGENGSITPSGSMEFNHGSEQIYTITPAEGYHVADVLVDGSSVGAITSYAFINVTTAHSIEAAFAINTYEISATAGENGSVTPSGSIEMNHGSEQVYTIAPAEGYHVADVLIDSISVGAVTSYTFTSIVAGHSIEAIFAINKYTITATAGENGDITPSGSVEVTHGTDQIYTITPADGYHVADVMVDGISVGAITSYTFSNVTSIHSIEVSFAINTYTIIATAGENGSISPHGSLELSHGSDQAYTITPAEGYHIANILVDGVSVGAVPTYTFSNVTAAQSIEAVFAINTYTIAATTGENGDITPSGSVEVTYGTDQIYTITPAEGYHVADVLVDGTSVGAAASYTFSNISASHNIDAAFAINTYTVTASAGENGTIAPSGSIQVNHGSEQVYVITPAEGYHIADVLVDGVSAGAVPTYTFSSVTTGHSIEASFEINSYTIATSAAANGSISPSGSVEVIHGSDQTFSITPAEGYHVADVLIDGVSAGSVTSYNFSSIIAAHTIEVSFAINIYTIAATTGENGSVSPSGSIDVNAWG